MVLARSMERGSHAFVFGVERMSVLYVKRSRKRRLCIVSNLTRWSNRPETTRNTLTNDGEIVLSCLKNEFHNISIKIGKSISWARRIHFYCVLAGQACLKTYPRIMSASRYSVFLRLSGETAKEDSMSPARKLLQDISWSRGQNEWGIGARS